MDGHFISPYRGDPGVPHTDPEAFLEGWLHCFSFAAATAFHPVVSNLSNRLFVKSHDKALKLDHLKWTKALEKKLPTQLKGKLKADKQL